MKRFQVTGRQAARKDAMRSLLLECDEASIPTPDEIDTGREILARFNGFALLLNEGDRIELIPDIRD